MEILYDFFLVAFGIIIGVLAADPLKKLFTGKYKEEKRQKNRVKLLVHLRKSSKRLTTEELREQVFANKISVEEIHTYLTNVKDSGLLVHYPSKDNRMEQDKWQFDQKTYDKNKAKF
ncbi:hypothetical protein FLK61_40835 [Paenalkalicoccus suaedae]|uniref:Uncharacterized protein n=1 Tax=Paenalkalicoccus suaedae TaxID=2592382 RepID=A0A859FJG8_9BACI|nr:hypothetical protein [Paenalkalicoccus suaedae]QKS72947.1 hypothetical protein FLK61_40835 [Paenalkalicoccus suaedae]